MCEEKKNERDQKDSQQEDQTLDDITTTSIESARLECGNHSVDCSTCPLSENCPLHESGSYI